MTAPERAIVTLNGGSSSLKYALYAGSGAPQRLFSGAIERIGAGGAAPDHERAAELALEEIDARVGLTCVTAAGHRIVHGGARYREPLRITADVLAGLRAIHDLDPDHLPAEIAVIEAVSQRLPALPQVACFDTAFHRTMPRVARLLPLPRRYDAAGVQRYGFHGLSYAFLLEELARVAGPGAARGRVLLAHLGAGASLAAVREGRCLDTTMGFTPTGGLVMGTRSGDLNPGVIVHLLRSEHLGADALDALVNREAGLLGVSEQSADMRDLLAREAQDLRAAEAVELFCYQAKKAVGAFAAVLGGIDTIVFAGGIGENAPAVRARIAGGLEHLGVHLDDARNAASAAVVSPDASACTVRVIRTDEESMIARETRRILDGEGLSIAGQGPRES